jgi:hypothetical protein
VLFDLLAMVDWKDVLATVDWKDDRPNMSRFMRRLATYKNVTVTWNFIGTRGVVRLVVTYGCHCLGCDIFQID